MAQKKRINKKKINPETVLSPRGMEAVKLIAGLFFAALAVYTLVAMLSYLFTWAEDQSLLSRPDAWNALVPVENGGGKLGFFWANFLLSDLFGLGAFIIPFFFGSVSVYLLRIKTINLKKIFYLTVYGAIILSLIFSYIFGFTSFNDWFGSGVGGSYGYYINEWLVGMLGAVGAGALIFVVFVTWLVLLNHNLVHVFNRWLYLLFHRSFSKGASGAGARETDSAGASEADSAGASGDDTAGASGDDTAGASEDDTAGVSGVSGGDAESVIDNGMYVKDVPFEIKDDAAKGNSEGNEEADVSADAGSSGVAGSSEVAGSSGVGSNSGVSGISSSEIEDEEPELVIEENDEPDFLKEVPKGSLDTLFDPRLDLPNYKAPGVELLNDYSNKIYKVPHEELERNNKKIVKTLSDYKISVERIFARTGPTVTLYEIVPSAGVRISQIKRLEDDIALSLAARGVRIIARFREAILWVLRWLTADPVLCR